MFQSQKDYLEQGREHMKLEEYLREPNPIKRLSLLTKMVKANVHIPLDLAFDLLELNLPIVEHEWVIKAIDVSTSESSRALEKYLTDNLVRVSTDEAALYIHSWASLENHAYSQKVLDVAKEPHCPQRVRYTVLLYADLFDTKKLLQQYVVQKDLQEYSDAFHALLLDRATIHDFNSPVLTGLAKTYMGLLEKNPYPESKAILPSLVYLKQHDASFSKKKSYSNGWQIAVDSMVKQEKTAKKVVPKSESSVTPIAKNSAPSKVEVSSRSLLFDYLYRNKKTLSKVEEGQWKVIADCYKDPSDSNLDELTIELRKSSGVYKQVFYKSFSAFAGNEKAVLKILDDLHTEHSYEQVALIDSLVANKTPRAAQELFNLIGRSFVPADLKIKIARKLKSFDLKNLQKQIRAAISEVELLEISPDQKTEIQEVLSKYIDNNAAMKKQSKKANLLQEGELPEIYSGQSAEVKRALRTGMFFHEQVKASDQEATMDLSPVIDMQYKAIEIYLRESFQQTCDIFVRDGVLQRKLDLIGYSRPIPEKMSQFENYIHGMPVISTIPYFSKFKLRKMLIALCQFRPSKRFTLDGLKAFALFFLCFSRQDCRYGVQGLFPLGFASDQHLFDFCKKLHEFQDFRNRAVHEGLPPGAENNIEQTWENTAAIITEISRLNQIAGMIKKHEESVHTPEPIIIRKGA